MGGSASQAFGRRFVGTRTMSVARAFRLIETGVGVSFCTNLRIILANLLGRQKLNLKVDCIKKRGESLIQQGIETWPTCRGHNRESTSCSSRDGRRDKARNQEWDYGRRPLSDGLTKASQCSLSVCRVGGAKEGKHRGDDGMHCLSTDDALERREGKSGGFVHLQSEKRSAALVSLQWEESVGMHKS
eukprot:scaffold4229_cov30-Tisochrysis_lutea.AAC.12